MELFISEKCKNFIPKLKNRRLGICYKYVFDEWQRMVYGTLNIFFKCNARKLLCLSLINNKKWLCKKFTHFGTYLLAQNIRKKGGNYTLSRIFLC